MLFTSKTSASWRRSGRSSRISRAAATEEGGTPVAHGNRKTINGNTLGESHIPVKNMMCAFGVPGNMIHGVPSAGRAERPVDSAVEPGI